jgi:ketosteroid isomerase-like protein
VLATGRYKAKHKKTGKKLNAQMAHVWTLKNGKVTKFQQYTDTKQASEVIK